MDNCRCNKPINGPIEFPIIDNDQEISLLLRKFPQLFPIEHNISDLKNKIICEYLSIINKLECGIQEDLEFLLEEISLVDIIENG